MWGMIDRYMIEHPLEDLLRERELEEGDPAVAKGPPQSREGGCDMLDALLSGRLVVALSVVDVKGVQPEGRPGARQEGGNLGLGVGHIQSLEQIQHAGGEPLCVLLCEALGELGDVLEGVVAKVVVLVGKVVEEIL